MLYRKILTVAAFVVGSSLGLGMLLTSAQRASATLTYTATTTPAQYDHADDLLSIAQSVSSLGQVSAPEEHTSPSNTEIKMARAEKSVVDEKREQTKNTDTAYDIFDVPFFSQFNDISAAEWKKVGCGIASLAMIIEFHKPGALVSVDTLLQEGIDADAYLSKAGWTYAGLIGVSKKYGLSGTTRDFKGSTMDAAFERLKESVREGPVMASVHYTFEPTNPIPHLVVVNGIDGNTLYYNDPAEPSGHGSLSVEKFKSAWKKRYIEFYSAT